MLIRIRYANTLYEISRVINKQIKDKESQELLGLVLLSLFCNETDYKTARINSKIRRCLKRLDLCEKTLDDVYHVLFEETLTYLPEHKPHLAQHCIPLSCIQKTSTDTYTLRVNRLDQMHINH
jgi:hypothetical protein